MQKISEAEMQIMKVLWNAERPLSLTEIREIIQPVNSWSKSTVKTLLSRLVKKKAIQQEFRDVYLYRPLVDQNEYMAGSAKSLSQLLFDGNVFQMIAGLISNVEMTEDDFQQLSNLIQERIRQSEND